MLNYFFKSKIQNKNDTRRTLNANAESSKHIFQANSSSNEHKETKVIIIITTTYHNTIN